MKNLNRERCALILKLIPVSSDETETIYEGCYETKDTSILALDIIVGCAVQFADYLLIARQTT